VADVKPERKPGSVKPRVVDEITPRAKSSRKHSNIRS
jgi:hypothetical protein